MPLCKRVVSRGFISTTKYKKQKKSEMFFCILSTTDDKTIAKGVLQSCKSVSTTKCKKTKVSTHNHMEDSEDFFRWHCVEDELFRPMRDALGEAVDFFDLFPTQQYLAEAAVGVAIGKLIQRNGMAGVQKRPPRMPYPRFTKPKPSTRASELLALQNRSGPERLA
jgi:hypothetical protein